MVFRRSTTSTFILGTFVWICSVAAADVPPAALNPAAISIKYPKDMKWLEAEDGSATSVMAGDPSKPGFYAVMTKWHPHHSSHPHFHPNDRFVTVVSGTWWVGTGTKYDPEHTTPVPPGSFVRHPGKQVHYDGARNEEVILIIMGQGPATMVPAEAK